MARLNIERQKWEEPQRIKFAKNGIEKLGYTIMYEDNTELRFMYKNKIVSIFPYSGWHSGKSIIAGRGLKKLLKQLEPNV